MSTSALRREDLLRWRLPSFQRKVRFAQMLVRDALLHAKNWYCAVSGGKDSTVMLDLVRSVQPDVVAIWADDELEHEESVTFLTETLHDVTVCSGFARHAGWFDPWRDKPYFREPLLGMIWTHDRTEPWSWRVGYDGCFVGLRKQEATRRRISLNRFGSLHRVEMGQWRCSPLASWDVADVWAYIAGRELPYNPVYDRLTEIGVPREKQRVGPLPLAPGWHLRLGWPQLYERLLARYGRRPGWT